MAEISREEPKRCPFCGWGTIVNGGTLFNHKCECNGCHASSGSYRTWEEAVKAWNRRENRMAISREEIYRLLEVEKAYMESHGGDSMVTALDKAISDMDKLDSYETKLKSAYGECDNLLDVVVDGLVKQAEEHKIGQPRKARLLTDEDVDLWEQSKKDREKLQKIEEGKADFEELERKMCRYFNDVDMSAEKTELERLALDIVCIGMQTMGCLNGILEN